MSNGMELQVFNVNQHQAFLEAQKEKLDRWCSPAGNLRAEMLNRYALHEMSLDQKLLACTPTSIYLALLQCAVTGLVPGKMRGFAYLVPFNNTYGQGESAVKRTEATFMIGWKGVKHMAFRSGIDIVSAIIYENDDFDFDKGSNAFVRYKPALKAKGAELGSAAWAKLPRGQLEIEYLDMERLNRIQKNAERMKPSPAWRGDFADSMRRKTAIRALGRQIEMGEEFHRAEMLQNAEEAGALASAIDAMTDGEATRVLAESTTSSMAFGQAPRPAQVQVPANVTMDGPKLERGKAAKNKPIEAQATERPTSAAATSSAPPQSSPTSSAPSPTPSQPAASPTNPTPDTSTAGSASPPASAATPAASSAPSSSTTPTSTASAPASSAGNGAQVPADQSFNPFDDPEDARVDDVMSIATFDQWLASCQTRGQITERKGVWIQWAKEHVVKGSPEAVHMQDSLAKRYAAVPE